MKKKHFTQISLAKEMGISRATISGWKSNLYTPTDERLEELCRILDIDDSEIFVQPTSAALKSNIDARTELLAVMLALSKLEDTIAGYRICIFQPGGSWSIVLKGRRTKTASVQSLLG